MGRSPKKSPGKIASALAESLLPKPPGDTVKVDLKEESGTAETLSTRIRTVEQALRKADVDKKLWDVERFVVNSWEMGAVGPDGKIVVKPLWQVKVWLKAKRGLSVAEFRDDIIKQMKTAAPKYKRLKASKRSGLLGEISLNDQHFGKLGWEPEVGSNYDLHIAEQDYLNGLDGNLRAFEPYPLSEILFVLGNDFLHTDNAAGTTSRGTPQDVDGRWQKAFLIALRAARTAIERCREVAPVRVLCVPGNHDAERLFYIGAALECQFHKCPGVTVDNTPTRRKYFNFGVNLLGFTHGNEEKHADLPRIMATERPAQWASSKHREIHIGHWHKRKAMHFTGTDSFNGVTVRVLPSLSGVDAWHHSQGYVGGLPSAEAYLFDKDAGYVAHFNTSKMVA